MYENIMKTRFGFTSNFTEKLAYIFIDIKEEEKSKEVFISFRPPPIL
jgi:hypothetical protein